MGWELPASSSAFGEGLTGVSAAFPKRQKGGTVILGRFCYYLDKVFNFGEMAAAVGDERLKPRIPSSAIWVSAVTMFATGSRSLNALDTLLRIPHRMDSMIGPIKPSVDTIGDVFCLMNPEMFRDFLSKINHQLRRNKVLTNDWPLRFAAIDGHEFFSSRSRCCKKCSQREITIDGEKITEYYHRGVVCHLIGFDIPVPLDVEMYRPGEGELTAAKRLVERVCRRYPRYFDAFVGDAIYLSAPIINLCQKHGKHIVAVLKDDNRLLLQDAEGIFRQQSPKTWKGEREIIKYWDEGEFTSFEGVSVPLRVIRAEETLFKRRRIAKKWVETTETHNWCWSTTIPISVLPSRKLWKAGHGRWDIENRLFHTLVTYWSMDHCFKHDPKAIVNFVLTLFITFIMFQCFYLRNLKPPLRHRFTLIALAREMLSGLAVMKIRAPWLTRIRSPAP